MLTLKEAENYALNCLARREHASQELAVKLQRKGCSQENLAQVIEACVQKGYLSDQRYCEAWIAYRVDGGYGPLKIKAELQQRGIDEASIKAGLDCHSEHWPKIMRQVLIKKFGESPVADYQAQVKQMRFLQNRGFTHEQIQKNVRSS